MSRKGGAAPWHRANRGFRVAHRGGQEALPTSCRSGRGRAGMSLVEILISLFLMSLALLPIFDLISKGSQLARTNEDEVVAFNLAAELIDQIACIPFHCLPPIGERILTNEDNGVYLIDLGPEVPYNPTLLVLSTLPRGFERTLTIENFNPRPNCCLKKVTARVAWGTDPPRQFTLCSLVEWRP